MTDTGAVCFDLDGTLCVLDRDDEGIHEALFDRVEVEPRFEPADVRSLDPATLPEADSIVGFYENMYGALADGYSSGERRTLAAATVEIVDGIDVTFRVGAREALEDARERFAVGLVTQGRRETQLPKLETLGIDDAFDAAVCCGPGTGIAGKPDPEPFRRALAALDADPGRAVHVGDSLRGDIAGAVAVGLRSVWVPRGEAPADPDPEPTHTLDSPGGLPALL